MGWMNKKKLCPLFLSSAPLSVKDSILVSLSSLLGGSWKRGTVAQHLSPLAFLRPCRNAAPAFASPREGRLLSMPHLLSR